MSAPTAPTRVRRFIRILGSLLLVGTVLVALALRRGVLPGFERRVAALKASGQPVVPSDLPAANPLTTEQVSDLFALNQVITQLDQQIIPSTPLTPGAPVFRETAWLRQQFLSLLRSDPVVRSLRIPQSGTGGYGSAFESFNRTKVLQRIEGFLLTASLDSIQRGRADEALGSFTNAIRLRTKTAAYPGGSFWTLKAVPHNRNLMALLESGALQPSHLRELQEAIQALEAAPLLKNQLLADRVQYIYDTRALPDYGFSSFASTPGLRGMLAAAPKWISFRIRLQLGFLDQAGCMALDEFDAQLADLERIGTPGLVREADRRHAQILSSSKRVLELYFGPQSILRNGVLLPRTHLRLGMLAIASARYRLDHGGEFPTTPSDLVPRYLTELPIDPFSGGAPVFELLNPGLAIGFDRSRLTGADSLPPTEPGGSAARLILSR